MDTLPSWLLLWCAEVLAARPVESLFRAAGSAEVYGVGLDDGRRVVVKRRPDEAGRSEACVAVQSVLAERGFPCPRPLTGVTLTGGFAIHAEVWRPGGELLRGDDPRTAARFAELLAQLITAVEATAVVVPPPVPNPVWVRWDHTEPGVWPAYDRHDTRAGTVQMPDDLIRIAVRARGRLTGRDLPCVLGHADWETQNLRWQGGEPYAVHDWDSVAWLPEAALAGAACGAFASAEVPTLAPIDSSAAFLTGYQQAGSRSFTAQEQQIAWAASLWPAIHNARGEVLYDTAPVALTALRHQAPTRLALAGA